VEIKGKGKLIVNGGDAHQPDLKKYHLGGGGGGIIQIIAPRGSLADKTLLLTKGHPARRCGDPAQAGRTPTGYFLLKGNYTAISKLGRLACVW